VPVPPGAIQGSTGSAPQWSVLLLVRGAAAPAHRAAIDFYRAHGFAADTDSIVHRGAYRITVVVENRDHSPNETFLAIALTQGAPQATPPSLAPSVLPGRPSIGLAEARRAGLQVAFVAPAGASTARIRVLRGRLAIASKTATVHAGRNSVVVRSAALKRRLRPGRYVLQVVLRAANGTSGAAGSTGMRVTR
jgi:hypothetical protein